VPEKEAEARAEGPGPKMVARSKTEGRKGAARSKGRWGARGERESGARNTTLYTPRAATRRPRRPPVRPPSHRAVGALHQTRAWPRARVSSRPLVAASSRAPVHGGGVAARAVQLGVVGCTVSVTPLAAVAPRAPPAWKHRGATGAAIMGPRGAAGALGSAAPLRCVGGRARPPRCHPREIIPYGSGVKSKTARKNVP